MTGFVGLVDKLSKNVIPESCSRDALYPAHLTPTQIHNGIRRNFLYQGTFRASRDNFLEGTANVDGFERPVSCLLFVSLVSFIGIFCFVYVRIMKNITDYILLPLRLVKIFEIHINNIFFY